MTIKSLLLSCIIVATLRLEISAQEGTPSHRLLGNGLPAMNGGQAQIELLRRLQMLSGTAQAKSNELLKSQTTDPSALKSLQEAMQNYQRLQNQPPGTSVRDQQTDDQNSIGSSNESQRRNTVPNPQAGRERSSTGNQSDGTPSRSALQRIAEQMGLSLDRTQTTPPNGGLSQGNLPGMQTGQRNRNNQQSGQRNQNGNIPNGQLSERGLSTPTPQPGSRRTSEPENSTLPAERGLDESSPGTSPLVPGATRTPGQLPTTRETAQPLTSDPRSEADNGNKPKGPIKSLLNWLTGRDQQNSNNNQPSRMPASGGSDLGTGRSGEPGSEPDRTTRGSRNNPGNTFRNPTTRSTPEESSEPQLPGSSWFPGNDISPPRTRSENAANQQRQGSSDDVSKEDGTRNTPGQLVGASTPEVSPEQTAEDRRNAQREERLSKVRSSSKTLRQKLAEIAKLARSESDQGESSDDPTPSPAGSGLQSAFVEALQDATKGLAEHVDELVTENRFRRRERGSRRLSRREGRGPLGRLGNIGDQANDWFVNIVEPAGPGTSSLSSELSSSDSSNSVVSFELVLALLILGGLVYWIYQRRITAGITSDSAFIRSAPPVTLSSRQDIIQAFHDLADRCPAVVADWWTHDRAAQALATSSPAVDEDVRQLAQLYEQARYLPDESSLTAEQFAAAKAAWLRCRKP